MNGEPTVRSIVALVAEMYRTNRSAILGHGRRPEEIEPRHLAIWAAWRLTHHSMPAVGRLFRRDTSTISTTCRRFGELIERDARIAAAARTILRSARGHAAASAVDAMPEARVEAMAHDIVAGRRDLDFVSDDDIRRLAALALSREARTAIRNRPTNQQENLHAVQ